MHTVVGRVVAGSRARDEIACVLVAGLPPLDGTRASKASTRNRARTSRSGPPKIGSMMGVRVPLHAIVSAELDRACSTAAAPRTNDMDLHEEKFCPVGKGEPLTGSTSQLILVHVL